ncbi:MAG: FlgD immunoglobulin-like domain containing protein [Candidatus Eisenbacteria bacterium]
MGGGACEFLTERNCIAAGGTYFAQRSCDLLPPGNSPGWRRNDNDALMIDVVQVSGYDISPDGRGGPGWNVWHRYDSWEHAWALSAGGESGSADRFTRFGADEANLSPSHLELRWDTDPDNYGWWAFDDDTAARVPFGLYEVDPQTGEERRLIVVLSSAGGTVGVFDVSSSTRDGYFGDPATDWIYAYDGDYDAFLLDARDGRIDDPSHAGNELFAELVFASESLTLPLDDTIVRFVTKDAGIAAGNGFAGEIPISWDMPGGIEACFGEPKAEVLRDGIPIGETERPDYLDREVAPGESHVYTLRSLNPFNGESSEESMPVRATASADGPRLLSGAARNVPVLDGEISSGEWSGARIVDATPFFDWEPAQMRFMNDENYLYLAIEGSGTGLLRIYIDGDANGVYEHGGRDGELRWGHFGARFNPGRGSYPDAEFTASQFVLWTNRSFGGYDVDELRISLTEGPLAGLGGGDRFGIFVASWFGARYPRGPLTVLREAPWLFAKVTLAEPLAVDGGTPDDSGTANAEETSGIDGLLPSGLALERSIGLPNPFGGEVTIAYRVPSPQSVAVRIYGTDGRLIRTLSDEPLELPGLHGVRWDGTDASGRDLPPGMYYYEVRGETFRWTDRLTRLR